MSAYSWGILCFPFLSSCNCSVKDMGSINSKNNKKIIATPSAFQELDKMLCLNYLLWYLQPAFKVGTAVFLLILPRGGDLGFQMLNNLFHVISITTLWSLPAALSAV